MIFAQKIFFADFLPPAPSTKPMNFMFVLNCETANKPDCFLLRHIPKFANIMTSHCVQLDSSCSPDIMPQSASLTCV